MTRIITILSAALILTTTAPASAAPTPNPGQGNNVETFNLCRHLMTLAEFEPMNLGECMSYNSVSEPAYAPHDCDAYREFGLLETLGFDSYSDCVRNF